MSAPSTLEDARDLLKLALELVEDDNGYCEMTRLMESVARAYIKACEALEAINAACPVEREITDNDELNAAGRLLFRIARLARAALSCSAPPEK